MKKVLDTLAWLVVAMAVTLVVWGLSNDLQILIILVVIALSFVMFTLLHWAFKRLNLYPGK